MSLTTAIFTKRKKVFNGKHWMLGTQKETNMSKLLLVLLYVYVLTDPLQAAKNKAKVPKNGTLEELGPKTFRGTRIISRNLSLDVPELIVSSNQANYTSNTLRTTAIPVIYLIAILVGIPSNCLVVACLRGKTESVSSAILYLSLAVSDLLLLVSLTLKVHYHLNGNNWIFGELACKLVTACFYGNIYCSIHAHMCISVLRYLAVVHPFLYRTLSKRTCTTWTSLTVWAVFAAAMVPELLVDQSYYIANVGVTACHDVLPYGDDPYKILILYRLCLICLGFMFPFAVIVFAYGSIVYQLSRSYCDWTHYIKASTLVFVIFLFCFTPSNVIHFIHYVRVYNTQPEDFYNFFSGAVCLCCFHSCLDPFLAYFITKTTNSRVQFISLMGMSSRASAAS